MRIAYLGTAQFGADVLRGLVERGRLAVEVVVSQPDRQSGRGRRVESPPVAAAARELGLPLLQSERASDEPPAADAAVVVAFGQILRPPLLGAYPIVNLHPSRLPRWRGAAPVERAIMAGDESTAVAVIELVAELDAGPVLCEAPIPIGPRDDAGAVRARAVEFGVPLIEQALLDQPDPRPQADEGVTYAEKLTAADRVLDWSRPAAELDRRVRALSPHIGARTALDGQAVVVWRAEPVASGPAPGMVADLLVVGCGEGALRVLELQPAGKRRMAADAYLRGLRSPPELAG